MDGLCVFRCVPNEAASTSLRAYLASVLLISLAAGCTTVGPDYQGVTSPPLPSHYWQQERDGAAGLASIPDDATSRLMADWNLLSDDTLNALIDQGLRESPSVDELIWRIEEAEQLVTVINGQACPFVDAVSVYDRRKRSLSSQPFVQSNSEPFSFFSKGFVSSWEIDLVGRIRRETEAAVAQYEATVEDLSDLQRILAGDICRAYINLRLNEALLATNRRNQSLQESSIEEVQTRVSAGQATRLDVVQLQSRIGLTAADSPLFRQAIDQWIHQLALLVGTTPDEAFRQRLMSRPQLRFPKAAPMVPAALLRRRPDVRRAEREVAAACALIGVAESEYYPRLALLGSISFDSRTLNDLIDYDSLAFGIGPSFSWNVLSLGRIEAQVEIQRAQLRQACARYRTTVLVAVSEVEDALAAQRNQAQRIHKLQKTVKDSREAVELALDQYKAERASLERVVSNQRRLLRSSLELERAQADSATAVVNLIQAVGGPPSFGGSCMSAPCECGTMPMLSTNATGSPPASSVLVPVGLMPPPVGSVAVKPSPKRLPRTNEQRPRRLPSTSRSR